MESTSVLGKGIPKEEIDKIAELSKSSLVNKTSESTSVLNKAIPKQKSYKIAELSKSSLVDKTTESTSVLHKGRGKKVVFKLDILDEKIKKKAMKQVSTLPGVDSIAMDMKDKKLTIIGDVDPVAVVLKLRKICRIKILSVGPAKEPGKQKEEDGRDKKKEDELEKRQEEAIKLRYSLYQGSQPYDSLYYPKPNEDENPNTCVIC
uniref:heavy metal-associated isoprenylated plant protein 39-like n=1 Tax=Erigeron canadensis TaxID=72917 RepID=UPI001CB8ACF1|nr:heavy metal-associated isoprenylated plant protein 39-like [Erigeron canadensis]